jgi:hypothetical protein
MGAVTVYSTLALLRICAIFREEVEIGEERPTDYSLRFQESEEPELLVRDVEVVTPLMVIASSLL